MLLHALVAGLAGARAQAQEPASAGGVLTGRVVAADGRPLPGVRVTAVLVAEDGGRSALGSAAAGAAPVPGANPSASSAAGAPAVTVTTDRRGAFAVLRLSAGTYQLSVSTAVDAVFPAGSFLIDTGDPTYVVLQAPSVTSTAAGVGFRVISSGSSHSLAESAATAVTEAEGEKAVVAGGSPGDRADTPAENEEHATGAEPDTGGAPNAAPLDGFASAGEYRSGARGGAAGASGIGATYTQGAVRSLRGSSETYSATRGWVGGQSGGMSSALRLGARTGATGLHGAGFVSLRLSAFDAANPYAIVTHYRDGVITSAVVKPDDTDVQAGAHAGFEPLAAWSKAGAWSERVFAFASLEGRVRNAPVESTPALPSFYALTATQRALLGTRGVPGAQVNAALDYLEGRRSDGARSQQRRRQSAR